MFPRGQLLELLNDAHVLYVVDVAAARNTQVALDDAVRGVGGNKEGATEAEVLRIVRREVDMDGFDRVYHHCIY